MFQFFYDLFKWELSIGTDSLIRVNYILELSVV